MKIPKDVSDPFKKWILPVFCVLYACLSLGYLLNLASLPANFTNSAFSAAVTAVLVFALRGFVRDISKIGDPKRRSRRVRYVLGTGFLLGLSFVLGYQMRNLGMTSLGVRGKAVILIASGGLGLAFSPIVNLWFRLLDRAGSRNGEGAEFAPKQCFFGSWILIFLCWIPAFLSYYPAIMSYDFHRQCNEAVRGFIWFNSYQPLLHTLLIWLFLQLGDAIGSYELAMAVFSLLQMLIVSAVLAYSCNMLGRLCRRKWPVILSCLLFALIPVYPVLALCMTKDILFSAFFLLTLLLMLERRLLFRKGAKKSRMILLDAGLVLSGILSVMFRNNTIYALAVFAVFYVVWSAGERIKVLFLCALILLGGQGAKEGLKAALGAGSGSNVEMCSVIIQTVARAAKTHESSMTDEEWEMCRYIVGDWEDYNPPLSDTLKASVAETTYLVWKNEPAKMLDYWLKLGKAYPNEYLDALLALTSGYWFLDDVSHAEVLGYGDETDRGLIYTFNSSQNELFGGVPNRSLWPGLLKRYQHIVNGNGYYSWPGISLLFKPAFYCWILILVMISLFYERRYKKLVLCMLPFWYLMTLFLGPVVNIRYVYPVMLAAPLLLGWLFSETDWDGKEEQVEKA